MSILDDLKCSRAGGWHGVRNRMYGVDGGKSRGAAAERREVPILAIVGANGGGKTWCAVYTVAPTLLGDGVEWECDNRDHLHMHAEECPYRRRGQCRCDPKVDGQSSGVRHVLGTVRLWDPTTEEPYTVPHPRYVALTSYQQLMNAEHCDVVLDEATGVADSQDHGSIPSPVRNLLAQQRKRDIRLIWTTPDYSNALNRIRQCTQGVVYCSGGAKVKAQRKGQVWRESRRLRWSLYSTADFEVFTATQRMANKPLSIQYVWRPDHLVDRLYDSQSLSISLGVATEGGLCLGCGGRRSAPRCQCPPDPDAVPEGVVEEVDARGTRRRKVAA